MVAIISTGIRETYLFVKALLELVIGLFAWALKAAFGLSLIMLSLGATVFAFWLGLVVLKTMWNAA